MATINPKQPIQVFRVVDSAREIIDDFGGGVSSTAIAPRQPVTVAQFVDSDGNIVDDFMGGVGTLPGLGAGVAAALAIDIGTTGSPVVQNGVLGTPSSGVGTNLTGTAASLTAGHVTTNANLTGDVTSVGNATTLATVNSNTTTFGSATKSSVVTANAKGLVTSVSETTVTPAVGSITGLGTGVGTALALNVGSAGAPVVFNGAGGTPSSIDLTNATNVPAGSVAVGSITGLGTGVATALAVNVGSAGAPVVLNGAGGTPSSLTGTNITGIPESGVTSLTSDLALKAPLASPTFTGTVVLPNSQALVTPVLGTPTSGTLTNCTGLPESGVTSLVSDLALKAPLASPTFTGTVVLPSGQALIAPALGTPASGVLTNCTGTAASLTAGTASAVAVGGITGLGTGVATALAVNTGSAGAPVLFNGAGGTPSSLTGTNISGTAASLTAGTVTTNANLTGDVTSSGNATTLASIPAIAGTNLTGTAVSLTAGNATKWTTARTIALTGDVTYTSGSLDGSGNVTGTATLANIPAIAGTNLTGTGASFTAGNATKWTTGRTVALTGDVTYTSGSLDGSGNATGAATLANIPVTATHATDLSAVPVNVGGGNEYFVTGSNVNISTTTGTGDVVTGLTSGTLSNSTKYEIDVLLHVVNAADANGMKVTVNGGGSGSTLIAHMTATTTAAAAASATLNTIDTLSTAFVTASSIPGIVKIHGFATTGATAAPFIIKCAKVTGNTATVQIGSRFRIRKAHT